MSALLELAEQPQTSTALALPANIADLCAGRDRAIILWMQSYDTLHANMEAAGAASIGGNIELSCSHDRNGRDLITPAFLAKGPTTIWGKPHASSRTVSDARTDFEAIVTAEIDRRCWSHMMTKLGFDQLLDRQAREEFNASLEKDPPAFTVENCTASFGHIWGNRREMYLRGIANVFMSMDRRFRSHDAFGIGNRLVLSDALSRDYSGWSSYGSGNKRDALGDVERVFRELDDLGPLPYGERISEEIAISPNLRPRRFEGDYFKIDVFKNGNIHLWFTRKDLLKQVNELLLEYYKPVEGDVGEGPSYETGPLYHATPAKNFGAFNSSQAVVDFAMRDLHIASGTRVLEPSAGTGMFAKAARAKGANVTCVEIQPGLAHELQAVHGFRDVRQADFLTVKPSTFEPFDVILMNPPFDRGRDCDHVRHAWKFLRPGGSLVAVMSARAEFGTDGRHRALHDLIANENDRYHGRAWRDLPEGSFRHAGTNVNTVVLTLTKKRAK